MLYCASENNNHFLIIKEGIEMKAKNVKRKVVVATLAVAMAVTLIPIMAFAAGDNNKAEAAKTGSAKTEDVKTEDKKTEDKKTDETAKEGQKPAVVKKNNKKVKIMLDAGHAGNYNRGYFRKFYESRMTWTLTNYLKNELKKYGFTVGMTKKSLWHDPKVYRRGKMAKGYDLFISIHSNWSSVKKVDYPLAIVSSKYKKKLYKKAQPIGKKLVKTVRTTMKTRQKAQVWIKRQRNGKDWYGVIRGAAAVNVPAVILEHSFHSNRAKCKWLMNKNNLKKMAAAEAKVLAKHYGMKKVK